MYYQNYDDYMRSSLGYEQPQMNPFNTTYQPVYEDYNTQDLNEFYPEIYRIVYPIVCRECSVCTTRNFNDGTIDEMVDRVYNQIEEEDNSCIVELRGNIENKTTDKRTTTNPRQETRQSAESEKETRAPRNPLLRDFIRVLLLRELIGNRPPFGRPNFPGGPGGRPPMPPPGGMRPPMPRYY